MQNDQMDKFSKRFGAFGVGNAKAAEKKADDKKTA